MGYLLLAGGAEFSGAMQIPDRHALALAGGPACRVRIVPAAAAPDRNHERAGRKAEGWFRSLDVRDARSVALIDHESAADPGIVGALSEGQLIYLLGGFPGYLAEVLDQSPAWQAILDVQTRGGVLAGSSAGAMVLCGHYYDPQLKRVRKGLGLLPNTCILPHHDTFGRQWAPMLHEQLPGTTLIGIDEQTGLIGRVAENRWVVRGRAGVTLYHDGKPHAFHDGDALSLAGR